MLCQFAGHLPCTFHPASPLRSVLFFFYNFCVILLFLGLYKLPFRPTVHTIMEVITSVEDHTNCSCKSCACVGVGVCILVP